MKKDAFAVDWEEYRYLTLQAVEDYNQKDYKTALSKFRKMEKANYANPKVHEIMAYIYLKLDDLDSAENQYEIYRDLLCKENPGLVSDKTFEDIVADAGELESVEKDFKKLMKKSKNLDPIRDFEIPSKLSVLYMSKGDFLKAEEVLREFKKKYVPDAVLS